MHRALVPLLLLCLGLAGCAQMNTGATSGNGPASTVGTGIGATLSSFNLRAYLPPEGFLIDKEQQKLLERQFAERRAQIERRAADGEITWFQAARQVRNLHRRSAASFERADEEYHAYSATVAEQLDAGRLTFAQYDALRTQRFNVIQKRRGN